MTQLNHETLFGYLVRLAEAKRREDYELLFKLIVLNTAPDIIHGFPSRTIQHDGLLHSISPNLRGRDVFFAGELSMKTNINVVLEPGGYSLENTGYVHDLEQTVAVHGLLGTILNQIQQKRFKLLPL